MYACRKGSGVVPVSGELDTVNVFSVASGHMYERLQRIMMLSVVNSTKARCAASNV